MVWIPANGARIEQVYREILVHEANRELDVNKSEALPLLAEVHRRLGRIIESCVIMPLQASVLVNDDMGRHCFIISYNQPSNSLHTCSIVHKQESASSADKCWYPRSARLAITLVSVCLIQVAMGGAYNRGMP